MAVRTKISQDLHDDVGASLSSIHIYSSVAGKAMHDNPSKAKEILEKISESTREVMDNISDIVWAMHPVEKDDKSFAGRIKNYGTDLLSQRNIECKYNIDQQAERKLIKPEARKNILLIVKEALNNISKYSEASQAEINISINKTHLHISITDNGKGFDPDKRINGKGLQNMKQRAILMGGNMTNTSSPGKGTTIQCDIPLAIISDR